MGKRKSLEGGSRAARNIHPPSLHALALVGSRLNQNITSAEPEETGHPHAHAASCHAPSTPSLLDQLCTVAENEHTAAAQMLSELSAF